MISAERKSIILTCLILGAASFLFFQFAYPYHFFFREQMQLFLFSSDYFFSYLNKPAWLACYLGDFFTQFFYLRGGAPVVLSVVFILEYFLVTKTIKRITANSQSWLWAILPPAIDWVLYLKLSYNLASSFSFILALVLFFAYENLLNRKLPSMVFGVLISGAAYWFVGSSVFIFPVLAVLLHRTTRSKSMLKWNILFFICWISPYFFLNIFLLPMKDLYLFPGTKLQTVALPVGTVFSICMAAAFGKLKRQAAWCTKLLVSLIVVFLVLAGVFRNANINLEKILSLDSEMYFGRPDKVLSLVTKYKLKNRYASYFTNIALAKQNLLPEKLLDYYQPESMGLILPVTPNQSWETIVFSSEVFFLFGDMNLAQHSAMLGNTFSPFQLSSRMIKRLAEINLIVGDSAAATKYLRLLDKTLFHRNWARAHKNSIRTGKYSNWIEQKQMLLPKNDTIRKPNDYLAALRFLVEQNPKNTTALDYLLCGQLLDKDLKGFKSTYDKYRKPQNKAVPKTYSEALLIVLYLQNATKEETLSYGISPQKMSDFIEYSQSYNLNNDTMQALRKKFGKTYWFYYHFATLVSNELK